MFRLYVPVATAVFLLAGVAWSQDDASSLHTASGTILKVSKDTLTVQSRGAKGEFGKNVAVKVTGTSKVTIVTHEKRAGKLVPIQRDADAKDLKAGQRVAVIYAASGSDEVLLSAVVLPAGEKK